MQVNLYATFRLLAGVKTFPLDLPAGTTALDAALRITALYPVLRGHWLDAQNELHPHVHLLINGRDVGTLPLGLQTPLQPEDVLDFFPPVAGG
jgi:molybdopterin synthase sulfur carrier subunit